MTRSNQYKLSYVVQGGQFRGRIVNVDRAPEVGEKITLDGRLFQILEVTELMKPINDFGFLHATCQYLGDSR